jgi:guanosine-3',5'-bis(diphosphate) 3'-pyrophosphohydrolase
MTINKVIQAIEFAAERHANQRRKGKQQTPYINHPIKVVSVLSAHGESDHDLLAAGALHDVIEDTAREKKQIEKLSTLIKKKFGERVLKMVLEVSDDKSLPYQERKRLQIIHTPSLSSSAKKLKIADKICNIQDLKEDPPDEWAQDRKIQYIEWAGKVIEGARGVNAGLENYFDQIVNETITLLNNNKL